MADVNKTIRLGHINAQSLEAHFSDICSLILENNLHILAISESWLKPTRSSNIFQISGFNLLRADRTGKRGGGVALYINNLLDFKIIDFSPSTDLYNKRPEFLFVLLQAGSLKILLGVIYNPPKCGYWYEVEEALLNCNVAYDFLMIVGDLNINWGLNSTPHAILVNFLYSYNLEPLPFLPTHHVGNSPSTIDYICVSDISKVKSFKQSYTPWISEHDVLFADLLLPLPRCPPSIITRRNFRAFNKDIFLTDLHNVDWHAIDYFNHVDDKVSFLTSNLIRLYDHHAPYQSFTPVSKQV